MEAMLKPTPSHSPPLLTDRPLPDSTTHLPLVSAASVFSLDNAPEERETYHSQLAQAQGSTQESLPLLGVDQRAKTLDSNSHVVSVVTESQLCSAVTTQEQPIVDTKTNLLY
jgi:hypothetical protein